MQRKSLLFVVYSFWLMVYSFKEFNLNNNLPDFFYFKPKTHSLQSFFFRLSCILFLLFSITGFAQIQTKLNPETILIGDTASLQITLTVDSESDIALPQMGDSLTQYIEISNIKTDTLQRGRNLNIIQNFTLIGFEPGEYLVKALPYQVNGKTILSQSKSLKINDMEVDENRQGLFPIKPIMKEEITWWEKNKQYVYYFIAAAVLALIAGFLIWLYFKEKKKNKYTSTPLLPPYEEALDNLKKLDQQKLLSQEKYYEFYSDLSFILKRYLERRFEFSAQSLLSEDLSMYVKEKEYLTADETRVLSEFMKDADLVKYARKVPASQKHTEYRNWVEDIIHHTKPLLEDTLPDHIPTIEESENLRKLDRS